MNVPPPRPSGPAPNPPPPTGQAHGPAKLPANNSDKTKIPFYGHPAPCKPVGFTYVQQQGWVEWSWNHQFSWLRLLLLAAILSQIIALGVLLMGILTKTWYVIVLGSLQTTIFCPMVAILPNWMWNARKQAAISTARFKSLEASKLWAQVDPLFYYQAKDLYFETSYGGKQLKVLRDGTIETHGAHNDAGDGSDSNPDAGDVEEGLDMMDALMDEAS